MLRIVIAIFTLILASLHTAYALETKIIENNGMVFWSESFGNQKNPTILLIMGSGGQGLLWPQEFCEKLADKGYHVIRFDNRDTGLSSSIDFKAKPYTLLDMAQDSLFILDDYRIQKAHIAGISTGGAIAALFAAHYPERTNSLILMSTTTDMRPVFEALLRPMFGALPGKESQSSLSKPSQASLDSATKFSNSSNITIEEKVQAFLENARINHGTKIPVDEKLAHQIALQHAMRAQNPAGATNHFLVTRVSYELHQKATPKVTAATLIIHGDQDPVFPLDHAYALQKAIKHAKLSIMPGMGHGLLNADLYQPVINKIDEGIKHVR